MADRQPYPSVEALRKLEESLKAHARAQDARPQKPELQTPKPQPAPTSNSPRPPRPTAPASDRRGHLMSARAMLLRWRIPVTPEWRLRLVMWWPRLRKLTVVG